MIKKVIEKYFYCYQRILEKYLCKGEILGEIWMFHCVSDDVKKWYDPDYSIRKGTLEQLILSAKSKGFKFESLDSIESGDNKTIYITYDDGFEGVYTEALEVMKRHGVPFCVFATIGLLGENGYMSKTMLKDLAGEKLCTVGAHTFSHPNLRTLNYQEAEQEIISSKEELEKIITAKVAYFAYPYGKPIHCGGRERKIVKKAGYEKAFSTLAISLTKRSLQYKYYIPRKNINEVIARMIVDEQAEK